MDKRLYIIAFIAFLFYQAVNFLYLPLHPVFSDEGRFIDEAIKFANSGGFYTGDSRAWEMPLTGVIYGTLYKIFGTKEMLIASARVLQSLFLIVSALLVYKISLLIFKDKLISTLAFIIVLFYPFFVYYQGLLISETIFITLLLSGFYYIYRWYENGFKFDKYLFLANLFLILSLYSKASMTILPPFLLGGFAFLNRVGFKSSLKIFLISFSIWIAMLSPWWIRNYLLLDRFVLFTTSSGSNLYLGNNSSNLYGGCDWACDVNKTLVAKIRALPEVEEDLAFKKEAVRFIYEHPKRFFELMYLKFKRFYNIEFNNKALRESHFNIIVILSYGSIFILFLISIPLTIKRWRELSAIYILFFYFTLLYTVTISSLRYRLPLEPFMIIMASYTLAYFIRLISTKKS